MVDVIIPVYNCEKFIIQCIESIKKQSVDINVLITDDGSKDGVKSILKNYESSNVNIYFNNKNQGNLHTVNSLLSKSKSEYIAFQDADDWSHAERIATQLDFINQEQLDFCFTNFIKTDVKGDSLYCGYYKDRNISAENIDELEPSICFASILFKREVYETIGGFNTYFNHIGGADIDWFYRAFEAGFKGGIISEPLYYYRNNDISYTSKVSLDPRKKISVAIARFFHKQRLSEPTEPALTTFISKELKAINFDKKANLKDYIVQILADKQYLNASKYSIKYLLTKPFKLSDFKILNYLLYKLVNGN